jgi:flagellar L-ring protein precursor FlgH
MPNWCCNEYRAAITLAQMVPRRSGLVLGLVAPGAFAQQAPAPTMEEEIRAFCGNIADAARDQRYLLAEKGARRASGGVDERISCLRNARAIPRLAEEARRLHAVADTQLVDIYKNMRSRCRRRAARNRQAGHCGDRHETEPAACKLHTQRDGSKKAAGLTGPSLRSRGSARPTRGSVMIRTVSHCRSCSHPGRMQLADLEEVGQAPSMSPVGSGLAYGETPQMAAYPKQPPPRSSSFSLWDDRRSKLFQDARAMSVGDILTVDLAINDKASFDNATDRSRQECQRHESPASTFRSSPPLVPVTLNIGSNTSTKGQGTTERSEKLSFVMAAVVTGILPNGNLVISGSQEVRVNQELRILNVAGIVRPLDVDHNNTVAYDKIAEARVSYGGRGRLTEVQQPPIGQQLVDIFLRSDGVTHG